jgi:hypothetical protein
MTFRGANRGHLIAIAALSVALAAPGVARAADDGQQPLWRSFGETLGLTDTDKVNEPIKYHERPRLVLPPSPDLPQPIAPSAMTADWPHDPDVEKVNREKEALLHHQQRSPTLDKATMYGRPVSPDLLRSDHAAPGTLGAGDHCAHDRRSCHWIRPDILERLGIKKDDDAIVAGQEPDREWLTDPPKGYRVPTARTTATFETPDHRDKRDQRFELYQAPSQ